MSAEEEDDTLEQLEKCFDTLLVCAAEKRICKKCKERSGCKIYLRAVLATLCMIEINRLKIPIKEAPMGIYI